MFDKFINLVVGDLDKKREYKDMMRRVNSLPSDYSFAFKKIQKYMYTVGAPNGNMILFTESTIFTDLLDLFESSARDGRKINDVIGNNVSKFCDEFMSAYTTDIKSSKGDLNKEIMDKFNKEEKKND